MLEQHDLNVDCSAVRFLLLFAFRAEAPLTHDAGEQPRSATNFNDVLIKIVTPKTLAALGAVVLAIGFVVAVFRAQPGDLPKMIESAFSGKGLVAAWIFGVLFFVSLLFNWVQWNSYRNRIDEKSARIAKLEGQDWPDRPSSKDGSN